MDNLIVFGERLSEVMFEKGIDCKELSAAIGVSMTTIYRWKDGTQRIFLKNLVKLSDFFSCSIDFLLGRSEKMLDFSPQPCMPFYQSLREVMTERRISRYRIAKDTNIGDDYFTTWKNGSDPHVLSLIQLADYLSCTVDYLVGRER